MRWQKWRQGSAHPERDEELLLLLLEDKELDEDEELLDEEEVPSRLSALRSSSSASRARSALFSRSCTRTAMLSLQQAIQHANQLSKAAPLSRDFKMGLCRLFDQRGSYGLRPLRLD